MVLSFAKDTGRSSGEREPAPCSDMTAALPSSAIQYHLRPASLSQQCADTHHSCMALFCCCGDVACGAGTGYHQHLPDRRHRASFVGTVRPERRWTTRDESYVNQRRNLVSKLHMCSATIRMHANAAGSALAPRSGRVGHDARIFGVQQRVECPRASIQAAQVGCAEAVRHLGPCDSELMLLASTCTLSETRPPVDVCAHVPPVCWKATSKRLGWRRPWTDS